MAAKRAKGLGRPDKPAETVFEAFDLFGNTVALERSRWEDKILLGHADMKGKERLVQSTVEQPDMISESSDSTTRFVFDRYGLIQGSAKIVRAILDYGSVEIEKGSTSATIVTAYTPLTTATGKVGRIRYFAGKRGGHR